MTGREQVFLAVDDGRLAAAIRAARKRIVFAAPGLGKLAGHALAEAISRLSGQMTIILDADAEACRIGYGDPEALQALHDAASRQQMALRRQPGLRIGILIADDTVLIWSPIARSVESERREEQPNGLVLEGPATDICSTAMGADGTSTLPNDADIGREPLTLNALKDAVADLERNPPAPFDLARRTRVFSSRFQFVEFELRGAQWTERKINLSSVLLNADLPETLRDILDTQIRPYQEQVELSFEVPYLMRGRRMFDEDGERINVMATQSQVLKYWQEIRDHYLRHLPGFGWLIRKDQLQKFRDAAEVFEETLRIWVKAFREHVRGREGRLVNDIVTAVYARIERAPEREKLGKLDLEAKVKAGLARMRVIEPQVRIVLKNVAWESTRDAEFQAALEKALSASERKGWFEEFTAARERTPERRV
jgi:hypothetical protein